MASERQVSGQVMGQMSGRVEWALLVVFGLVFWGIGLGGPGFWEPWESGLVEAAQFAQDEGFRAGVVWVPQTANHVVDKPWGQMWALMAVLGLGGQGEGALRLPGMLVALGVLAAAFGVTRRMYGRGAGWAVAVVMVSLPMLGFGARLLVGGIWQVAAVALPVLAYVMGAQAQGQARQRWGALWGVSLLAALILGGLWGVGLSLLVVGAHAAMGSGRWRAVVNVGAAVGVGVSVVVGAWMVSQYQAHVGVVVERPEVMGVDQLERAVKAGEVAQVGVSAQRGGLVGRMTEAKGGAWFVVAPDPQWVESPQWALWLKQPRPMDRLTKTLIDKKLLDQSGQWAPLELEVEVPAGSAWHATMQFLTYQLFDPGHLGAGQQAVVSSEVGVEEALGKVWATREAGVEAQAGEGSAKAAATLKGGQVVTVLSEEGGWSEVEYQGNKTGFVRSQALKGKDALTHRTFETWIRTLFYGLFPWVMVLPFAVGGLMIAGLREGAESKDRVLGELVLVWFGVGVLGLGLGGSWLGQGAFVGVVPVALACGVWVSEARFWEALRRSKAPLLRKLIGFTALFLLVILLHDFYKNPWLFVTGYLFEAKADWDEKLRIMEGPFRALRMAFAVVFAAGLLGAFGWGERVLLGIGRGVKARFGWGQGLNAEEGVGKVVVTAWGGLRAVARPRLMLLTLGVVTALLVNYGYLTQITHHLTQKGLVDTYLEVKQGEEPLFNMQQSMTKTCKHAGECGKGQTCVSGRCVDEGVGFYLRDYAQVTQSALVDRLRKALAAELLPGLRERMDAAKSALGAAAERERTQRKAEVEAMQRQLVRLEALVGASADDGRFFAVLPRKQLSQINSQFRLLFPESGVKSEDRRNLAVLDNRSSQFVLISNQVRPGDVDQNPLNRLILKGKPSPQYQPEKRIKFEKGLEVVGYDVVLYDNLEAHLKEPPPAQQPLPVGVVGKKLVIIYYFYVGDRDGKPAEEVGTPGKTFGEDWQMFLHVDEGGNRINGDHYPGDGDFHTDTWVVGDYVRDIHVIEVETGSSSGIYTMWFGFFKGDQRLKVVDGEHQDNRAKLGQIRIQGTL